MFKIRTQTLLCDLALTNSKVLHVQVVHWHLVLVEGLGVSHGPQVGSVTDGLHTHLHIGLHPTFDSYGPNMRTGHVQLLRICGQA